MLIQIIRRNGEFGGNFPQFPGWRKLQEIFNSIRTEGGQKFRYNGLSGVRFRKLFVSSVITLITHQSPHSIIGQTIKIAHHLNPYRRAQHCASSSNLDRSLTAQLGSTIQSIIRKIVSNDRRVLVFLTEQ